MVCSKRAGAHTHHKQRASPLLKSFPRGILIHPMEDLCLGLWLAPLRRPGSFCYSHCSFKRRLRLFLSALPLPLQAKNQRAIWKSPLVSTRPPIFPSLSSTAKRVARYWLLSLVPTVLNI